MKTAMGMVMLATLYVSATPPPEEQTMSLGIQEVKAKHTDALLRLPGVTSVGIGRSVDGTPAIIIGLDRRHAATAATLPASLEGYAVRVELIGTLKAQ